MHFEIEEYVFDIAEHVSRSLGDNLDTSTTRWINHPIGKERVKDATLAFYVDGRRRTDDVVLLISNSSFPTTVQADVAQARAIADRVTKRVGRHIPAPVHEGMFGKQTYAVFSRLSPLSDFRLVRLLQKNRTAERVFRWVVELALETLERRAAPADFERYFVHPLTTLCNDRDVSTNVRDRANECLMFVGNKNTNLFTTVQHGDLWFGNVLLERRRFSNLNPTVGNFSVIDWRGARLDGYPCFDWMRLCSSLFRVGSTRNDELVSAYTNALKISAFEFQVYCFLALGRLGAELDQFPKKRYVGMCDKTLSFLDNHSR